MNTTHTTHKPVILPSSGASDMTTLTTERTTRGLTTIERALLPMNGAMLGYLAATPAERRAMVADARNTQRVYRAAEGYSARSVPMFTKPEAQTKLRKSAAYTLGLTLLPWITEGIGNTCPAASLCRNVCLVDTGKGRLRSVQHARRTRLGFTVAHAHHAGVLLAHEMTLALAAHGGDIRVRLNVLSDVRWERVIPDAMLMFHVAGVRFYDYTKWAPRHRDTLGGIYSLTYSASERMTVTDIQTMVANGYHVAVVLRASKAHVKTMAHWHGMPAVDGLSTDDRTTDPEGGCVVLLAALGDAIHDTSGFVFEID